jgi:hypothetical protein
MPVLAVLPILVAGGLAWLVRGEGDNDAPARIVATAAGRLPACRQDWGQAMVAELTQIHGRSSRWRFAAAMLRVALVLLPPPRRRVLLAAGGGGLIVTAAVTAAATARVPDLSVFAAALGLLLTGYATLVASRSRRPYLTLPQLIAGAAAFAGAAASITAVTRIAVAHPSATADRTHAFSVLFAITLTSYLALTQTLVRLGGHTAAVLWWGLTGALASGAAWSISALAMPVSTDGIAAWLWPVGAAATLAVSAGAAAACRSSRAGLRAGMLTTILGALLHFTIDLTALLHLQHYTLTSTYDIAAYPRSGYPDVASYILSDQVGGDILAGLVLYPLSWLLLAALGAAAGAGLRQFTARHTPPQRLTAHALNSRASHADTQRQEPA